MSEIDALVQRLKLHLERFEWLRVTEVCAELAAEIRRLPAPLPLTRAVSLLKLLRRKRRFAEMEQVADALRDGGQLGPSLLTLVAQALIDRERYLVAEAMLERALGEAAPGSQDRVEMLGQLGRVHKQRYVSSPAHVDAAEHLSAAIRWYQEGLVASQGSSEWCAINIVACLARARRDHVRLKAVRRVDERAMARSLLDRPIPPRDPWAFATRMEAHLALDQLDEMLIAASHYLVDRKMDAFELRSTLRQLREVWQLSEDTEPGGTLLPLFEEAQLQRPSGELTLAKPLMTTLQARHSDDAYLSPEWLRTGAERCGAIARIETQTGVAIASGFLVRPEDFLPARRRAQVKGALLLTNHHVIPQQVRPEDAYVRFEMGSGKPVAVRGVVMESETLDFCLVELKVAGGKLAPCPLTPTPEPLLAHRSRVYAIGHPGGRHLSFTLHDTFCVFVGDKSIRYRSATEGGSSGCPVFDERYWSVLALHKGTSGTSNEGVSIAAIRECLNA